MPRLTVYLSDTAHAEVQRRVDAVPGASLSSWVAEAVDRSLAPSGALDEATAVTLQADLARALADRDAARAACAEAEARCGTAGEELAAVRAQLHAVEVQLAAATARCEAQQATVQAAAAHLADLKGERDRLRSERDDAVEELRQRSLPMVVEQSGGVLGWLSRHLQKR